MVMVDSANSSTNSSAPAPVAALTRPPLPRWTVPVVALLVLGLAAVASVLLWHWVDELTLNDALVEKKATAHLDVLKLAASIAVGGGGLFALYLAARRQRTQELELAQREKVQAHAEQVQKHAEQVAEHNRKHAEKVQEHAAQVAEANRVHAERVAEATERDAAARRVTDLFTKSVEQLGSEKAAVRLGGMYALERLAQDNPDQRPTVVNVFCAYLRMPFEPPGTPPAPENTDYKTALAEHRERVQEREVRVAAQRILRDHLHKGTQKQSPAIYWPDTDLDLTNAHLINFNLNHCTVRSAIFRSATFTGPTYFVSATFTRYADFRSATFTSYADFRSATFTGSADFRSATFTGPADFGAATFSDFTDFESATFTRYADFQSATFTRYADFQSATFSDFTDFESTTFTDTANFESTTFTHGAPLEIARFIQLEE
jgi:hypothetical protein